MTIAKVIRYKTKPGCAEDNEHLIHGVYAELAADKPEGLYYASFRLDDGVSFLHVAVLAGDENPLLASGAFDQFQVGIGERLVEGPVASDATLVGSYRFFGG